MYYIVLTGCVACHTPPNHYRQYRYGLNRLNTLGIPLYNQKTIMWATLLKESIIGKQLNRDSEVPHSIWFGLNLVNFRGLDTMKYDTGSVAA